MMQKFFPIVLIVLAAAIGYFYIYPTFTGDISTQQQQIASYDSALSAAATFSKKENELITERNAIDPTNLARLQEYMPDGVDNIQLILDLDTLASRYGISLSTFAIQDNSADASGGSNASSTDSSGSTLQSTNSTDSLQLTVTASGTYDGFQAFLTAIELSLRPLDITALTLTSVTTGVYTYNITFQIYWLP